MAFDSANRDIDMSLSLSMVVEIRDATRDTATLDLSTSPHDPPDASHPEQLGPLHSLSVVSSHRSHISVRTMTVEHP